MPANKHLTTEFLDPGEKSRFDLVNDVIRLASSWVEKGYEPKQSNNIAVEVLDVISKNRHILETVDQEEEAEMPSLEEVLEEASFLMDKEPEQEDTTASHT